LILSTPRGALHGTNVLWRRAGPGRGVRPWQCLCYAAGWLSLAAALTSPLHWIGERLFTAHMIEHEVVMAVSAPLLALARPVGAFLWALPRAMRAGLARTAWRPWVRATWSALTHPMVATVLHGVAIWAWHVPVLFEAAVLNLGAHRLQHATFLSTALLFWWSLLRARNPSPAVGHVLATMVHTGLLGAMMTFAPRVAYVWQTADAGRWGLTPLEDQQLAGLVMWVAAGSLYAGAALGFAATWIRRSAGGAHATPAH